MNNVFYLTAWIVGVTWYYFQLHVCVCLLFFTFDKIVVNTYMRLIGRSACVSLFNKAWWWWWWYVCLSSGGSRPGTGGPWPPHFLSSPSPSFLLTTYYCPPPHSALGAPPQKKVLARTATVSVCMISWQLLQISACCLVVMYTGEKSQLTSHIHHRSRLFSRGSRSLVKVMSYSVASNEIPSLMSSCY